MELIDDATTRGRLDGLRVLDLTRVIAGPHCTRLLAELGAEVIKVEPPEGDQTRATGPLGGISSTGFVQLNLGKRFVAIDLGTSEGRVLLRRLIASVDVLIENFRPGVMRNWGLDYASIADDFPTLIYVSISGYGQSNGWSERRAYAPFVHAEAGYLDSAARLRRRPVEHDPMSVADVVAAKDATIALLAAVIDRQQTGRGTYIDISLAHSILYANEFASAYLTGGPAPKSGSTPQAIFTTSDGAPFSAGNPVSGQVFNKLCRAFGCPELIDDPRFAESGERRQRRSELIDALQVSLEQQPGIAVIEERLAAEALPIGQVRRVEDVPSTEWATERGAAITVTADGRDVVLPSVPWRYAGPVRPGADQRIGAIGSDNATVLAEAGIGADEVERLLATGVLHPQAAEAGHGG